MNKMFKDEEELLDYAYDFLIDYENCLFLTEYINSLSLAERLEEENDNIHIIDEVKEGEPDTIVYIQNLGKGVYLIQDFFNENGDIIEEEGIGDDFVLIQKGLLLNEIVDEFIYAEEDLDTIELVENKDKEEPEPCICCEECSQGCEEDGYYDEQFDLIDTYYELMRDNDFEKKAVKQALMEFGEIVLRDFKLDNEDTPKVNQTYNVTVSLPNTNSTDEIVKALKDLPKNIGNVSY